MTVASFLFKLTTRHGSPVIIQSDQGRGSYEQWTRGPGDPRTGDPGTRGPEDPRTEDPRTRGPEDQGPEDIITEGCFALQQLPIAKIQIYSQSRPMLQIQTHGYVLFIVTEGVTFNKQRYFKLSSEFFDAQSSLLSVLQSHIPVETIMHVSFDPGTCAHLASHAATC